MLTISFVVALGAVLSFVIAAVVRNRPADRPSRIPGWDWVAIGLALLTIAWILQLVVTTGGKVSLT